MRGIVLATVAIFMLSGCGTKTLEELKEVAKVKESYTVNEGYQQVYKQINDKILECKSYLVHAQKVLYSDLGRGEIYMDGGDGGDGWMFLVYIEKAGEKQTNIRAYSALDRLSWKRQVAIVSYGAHGRSGCPE